MYGSKVQNLDRFSHAVGKTGFLNIVLVYYQMALNDPLPPESEFFHIEYVYVCCLTRMARLHTAGQGETFFGRGPFLFKFMYITNFFDFIIKDLYSK